MDQSWAQAGTEPSLTEMLSDPVVHGIMRRDRLSPEMVWSAIRTGQEALRRRAAAEPPPAARRRDGSRFKSA